MQANASNNYTEKYDYLNQTDNTGYENGLTTIEKDLDHPSPLKNSQRAYSADAPLSAV